MSDLCSNELPIGDMPPCDCNYLPNVKEVKVMKDENGQLLIQVNSDGVWRGCFWDKENNIITFSY